MDQKLKESLVEVASSTPSPCLSKQVKVSRESEKTNCNSSLTLKQQVCIDAWSVVRGKCVCSNFKYVEILKLNLQF